VRILFWGSYDLGKPRNRLLIDGLRRNRAEVLEQHVSIWDDIADKSLLNRRQRLRRGWRLLAAYPGLLLRFLRAPRPDVVIVGYMGQIDVLILWVFACLRRVPLAWDAYLSLYNTLVEDRRLYPRGGRAWLLYLVEWLGVRAADRVFLDTDAHCDYFARRFGVDRTRFRTLRLGVEDDVFFPPRRPPDHRGEAPFLLLFYGQLAPLHGVDVILEAAKQCEDLNARWLIIGRGQSSDDLRRRLDDLKPNNVEWMSWVPYRALVHLIHGADVCLGLFSDSRKARMVIPNKVLQPIAAGCPVITADTPAMRERIWPAGAIRLVPPGDPTALAQTVRVMASDLATGASSASVEAGSLGLGPREVGAELLGHLHALTAASAKARGADDPTKPSRSISRQLHAAAQRMRRRARDFARQTIRGARYLHVQRVIAGARLFPRAGPFLVSRISGTDPLATSNRIAIYAHFDPDGRVQDYHLEMLRALATAGFRTTLVSNAEGLDRASAVRAAPLVREILVRRNIGYDFGAWRDALLYLGDRKHVAQLLLCNDSVYGPFASLAPLLRRADPALADVWGMTEGRNHGPHLQSYWLLFHRAALRDPAFARFWQRLPYIDDKFAVVEAGELSLSRCLRASGLRLQALFPYDEAMTSFRCTADPTDATTAGMLRALDRGRPMNPTHHFWRVLVSELGCPFIKRELLTLNPARLSDIADWAKVIETRFGEHPASASDHLQHLVQQQPTAGVAHLMRYLRGIMSAP